MVRIGVNCARLFARLLLFQWYNIYRTQTIKNIIRMPTVELHFNYQIYNIQGPLVTNLKFVNALRKKMTFLSFITNSLKTCLKWLRNCMSWKRFVYGPSVLLIKQMKLRSGFGLKSIDKIKVAKNLTKIHLKDAPWHEEQEYLV